MTPVSLSLFGVLVVFVHKLSTVSKSLSWMSLSCTCSLFISHCLAVGGLCTQLTHQLIEQPVHLVPLSYL